MSNIDRNSETYLVSRMETLNEVKKHSYKVAAISGIITVGLIIAEQLGLNIALPASYTFGVSLGFLAVAIRAHIDANDTKKRLPKEEKTAGGLNK